MLSWVQDVVGERPVVVVQSESLLGYQVGELGSLEEVGVASVKDYLTSHTSLLRVSSSLPAVINTQQTTPGVYICVYDGIYKKARRHSGR